MIQIWEVYGYIPIIINAAASTEHVSATPACVGVIDAYRRAFLVSNHGSG